MSYEVGEFKRARGGNIRNGKTTFPQKLRRQASAKARLEKYNKMTTQQKLESLNQTEGPDKAARQRNRLLATIAKENMAIVMKAAEKSKKK